MKLLPAGVLLVLSLSAGSAGAQVLITEVQPDTTTIGAEQDEWVELHNTGTAAVDVGGWQLHDFAGGATPRVYVFDPGTLLGPNQVVIVTMNATQFAALASTNSFPVAAADYELAIGGDDLAVPNLTNDGTGSQWALGNSGDAVELMDDLGTQVDAVEWGSVDRVEIAGTPAPDTTAPESLCRINNAGDSALDFAICATPTPGTGFVGPTPTPPLIANPTRAPANLTYGDTFTLSATVSDADGVAGVEVYLATATATVGDAAGAYVAATAVNTGGNNWRAGGVINTLVAFPQPTGFAERYVRYFVFALDNLATEADLPAGAVTSANNTAYYWENVLPPNTVFPLADVRQENAAELPRYDGHTVRVEGVALTTRESFLAGSTNFFIAAPTGVDAIRVFDDALIAADVQPGDMVRVTGKIAAYRGVRQIGRDERVGQPVALGTEVQVTVIGTATVPLLTTDIAGLLAEGEANESQLVHLAGVTLVPNPTTGDPVPPTWAGNTTLYVDDGTGTLAVRVATVIDLADTPTPTGTFDLEGIFTQFAPTGIGGYQLQPRGLADVIGGGPPVDGGVPDGGGNDAGGNDAGVDDQGQLDASGMDAATADSGVDTGTPDSGGGADATAGDSGKDAGFFGTDRDRGCGCSATPASSRPGASALFALLLAGLALGRRRRRR